MEVLKKDIDVMINAQCTWSTHCTNGALILLLVLYYQLLEDIRKLKHDKKKRWRL